MSDGPVVICVAPNGARRTKADHASLPMTAQELAQEASSCAAAGACALHLHVRDAHGRHTLDAERYREAITLIRARVGHDLVIQITTEAMWRYSPASQRACVRAVMPEAVSVAIREMIPNAQDSSEAASFYAWAREARIAVQHVIYSAEEAERLVALIRIGIIAAPAAALFVLGHYTAQTQSSPWSLIDWLRPWPRDWPWMVCGFGAEEAPLTTAAIGLGGHVRVGFENNLLLPDGAQATSNAQNVKHSAETAHRAGRGIADRARTLRILGGT